VLKNGDGRLDRIQNSRGGNVRGILRGNVECWKEFKRK